MRIIAFDPGDVHCGIAAMKSYGGTISIESRVLDVRARGFARTADEVSRWFTTSTIVVAEDFRIRPTGANRLSTGYTLRLLGALEYATYYRGADWNVVPAGNAERELPELLGKLSDVLVPRDDVNWKHALSAWRVLARYLMRDQIEVLKQMRASTVIPSMRACPTWLSGMTSLAGNDLKTQARSFTMAL